MKIDQKRVQYILLLLILSIAGAAYYLGYLGYLEKAEQVKTDNKAIEARIAELNEKETHRAEYEAGIAGLHDQISEILSKYGPGNTPEKSIMFVRNMEKAVNVQIPSVSFSADTPVFVGGGTDEYGNPKVELDSTSIAFTYSTTYKGLKDCMDYINTYPERMNVNSFTASYSPEGDRVNGNMVLNLYSVKDADHEYVDPTVGGVRLGTDNIFGK